MISELASSFDLFQLAYCLNGSAEDAISSVLLPPDPSTFGGEGHAVEDAVCGF